MSGFANASLLDAILATATETAIVGLDVHGAVTVWNEGAVRITGWSRDEMVGQPVALFFTEADCVADRPAQQLRAAIENGCAVDERWHLRRDGRLFWASGEIVPLRQDGVHVGFLKAFRDGTQQRLDAEAQHAAAGFLRGVLAASADCIKVLDLEARLVFMTESGQRIMEVSDFNAIRGCPWPSFWEGPHKAVALAAIEAAKSGGIGRFQGSADTMAGNPRVWDVQITPILDAQGKPERLLSVSRDITALSRAEDALREAREINTMVMESSRDSIIVLDREGLNRAVSPGAIAAMEIDDADAILGLPWLRDWHGGDEPAAAAALATAMAGGAGRFRGSCTTRKGAVKAWDVAISPLARPDGVTDGVVVVARDITEQHRAEALLSETEARRRLAVEAADIGTWGFDTQTCTMHLDERCCTLCGVAGGSQISFEAVLQRIHPEDRERIRAVTQAAFGPGGSGCFRVEYRVVNVGVGVGGGGGSGRWIAAAGRALFHDRAGMQDEASSSVNAWGGERRAVRLAGTMMDVSERRHAEDHARMLGDELAHRVKNTLAMVQAIVGQTLRLAATPAEAQAAIDLRVRALARAHEMLAKGAWEKAAVRSIAESALQAFDDGSAGRFTLTGETVWLSASAAMSLALLLNELATNAAKYGALSVPCGAVSLSWSVRASRSDERHLGAGPDDEQHEMLDIAWQEHRGPMVHPPGRRGFGSKLIERGLSGVLGEVALTFPHEGVICRVRARLSALQP